jgi:predicted lipid-binding transport protein (Tim44 family)
MSKILGQTISQNFICHKEIAMKSFTKKLAVLLILPLALCGCATDSGLSERETGGLAGGVLGAGIGALAGAATGHAGIGTAIGAGAGLLTGAVAGEMVRREKEKTKQDMRQEMMQQQYQPTQYTPQPTGAQTQAAAPVQPQVATAPAGVKQEMNTKYNPRTGQTFPSNYTYDPNTGEELKLLQ